MEKIINPGLQHLAENIFLNLNSEDLKACQLINQSTNQILEHNPMFWIKKCIQKGISKENKEDWIKGVQSEMNSGREKPIALYLKRNFMNKVLVDLPQYTNVVVQDDFMEKIHQAAYKGHTKIVKILAPLADNPNAQNKNGETPIDCAARNGYAEIVSILEWNLYLYFKNLNAKLE